MCLHSNHVLRGRRLIDVCTIPFTMRKYGLPCRLHFCRWFRDATRKWRLDGGSRPERVSAAPSSASGCCIMSLVDS